MSTPQIFLIANDLSNMQILASVDESDIGRIKNGQDVTFTVQAYPDRTFHGTVQQVRLQSATVENVVNYTVVVAVKNDDGKLLPGMTASVDFNVQTAQNVLKVPNAALRFVPTDEMVAQLDSADRARLQGGRGGAGGATLTPEQRQQFEAARAARAAGGQQGGGGFGGFGGPGGARPGGQRRAGGTRPAFAQLWYQDKSGKLHVTRVRTGISDGRETVIEPRDTTVIKEGMDVIAGVTQPGDDKAAVNPFQQGGQDRRGGFGRNGGF
jgi:HlyD family secretion protein